MQSSEQPGADRARPTLLLLGSGSQSRNEPLLADLAEAANLVLLQPGPVTWQRGYVRRAVEIDPADLPAVLTAAAEAVADCGIESVVSYEETLLPLAGEIGRRLGLPGISAEAAAVVRDKSRQRAALATTSLRPTRSTLVSDAVAGALAAQDIGYPVIIKPTNLSGSLGVTVASGAAEFDERFAATVTVDKHGLASTSSVLVEELLDGPEFSVDCWVLDGAAGPLFTALVTKGFPPNAINVRCVVGRGIAEPDVLAAVEDAARVAAVACGLDRTIANVDLRWVRGEPRILEVNGRPAGELLPRLARLTSGLRMGRALAMVASGRRPKAPEPAARAAGVAFLYPPHELVFGGLATPANADESGVEEIRATAVVGHRVAPPPADLWGRVGWAVVTAPTAADVDRRLDRLERNVEVLALAEQREG